VGVGGGGGGGGGGRAHQQYSRILGNVNYVNYYCKAFDLWCFHKPKLILID
jgi:hypothetical protein